MTPYAARVLFLTSAASVAILLLIAGGMINNLAAIVVAGGAGPMFQMLKRSVYKNVFIETLNKAENTLDAILSEIDAHPNRTSPNPE